MIQSQEDPGLIEGDEEEIVTDNEDETGESLLIKRYSLNKATPPPLTPVMNNDPLNSARPIKTPSSSFEQFSTPSGTLQDTPYIRPVTPQSFRPHTAASQHESK